MPLYLVGGVVRDLLLRRKTLDLDLAVEGNGIAFARSTAVRYQAGIVLFERFATARMILPNGQKIDIASTRRESYGVPAALPTVKPSSLQEDLYRRDFTVNAMAIQLNAGTFGRLHDPFGGQRDLRSKTLRILHGGSFRDDPTRIFRAIRFMERFRFSLEPETRRRLTQAAATNLISRLSGPRLRNEIFLLLAERRPNRAIDSLVRLNLLRFLHPRLRYTKRIKRLVDAVSPACAWWHEHQPAAQVDRPVIYLAALLSQAGSPVLRSVARRLQLSSAQCAAIELSGRETDRIVERLARDRKLRPSQIHRLLTGLPQEVMVLLVAKTRISETGQGARRCRRRLARYIMRDQQVSITVRGIDLKKLGLRPGPRYTEILNRLLEARLDGEITTETDERELAFQLVNRSA